jgi:glucose-6-phosphate 1-dehydrogenase
MQVVGATAMEPPAGGDVKTIQDAKVSLFRAIAPADPAHYVRGQYDGYLTIDGVADGSSTETYTALRLEIDNWRWSGVPFFIRAGKRLPITQTRRADRGMSPGEILFDAEFAEQGGEGPTPYEVLLHAAMVGQTTRFTRQDGVDQTWRIMQPLLDAPPPVHVYAPGSWGPEEANALVAGHGRWHGPWIES